MDGTKRLGDVGARSLAGWSPSSSNISATRRQIEDLTGTLLSRPFVYNCGLVALASTEEEGLRICRDSWNRVPHPPCFFFTYRRLGGSVPF